MEDAALDAPPLGRMRLDDGTTLAYRELGSGAPVLLLHGWPTSSYLWRGPMRRMATRNRVLAPDLPGFGGSDKPAGVRYGFALFEGAIEGFLRALGVAAVGVAGHDLGGSVAAHWALRSPGRVTRLALLNTVLYPEFSPAVREFVRRCTTRGLREELTSPEGLAGVMREGVADESRLAPDAIAAVLAPFRGGEDRRTLARAGVGLERSGFAEIALGIRGVSVPVRAVYGERDHILPDVGETMARLQRDVPRARVTPLPGCGHFLQEEAPDRVGELLADFFATGAPPRRSARVEARGQGEEFGQLEVVPREQLGVGEELGGRGVGHHPPAGQDDRAVAEGAGEQEVVGHDDHRPRDPGQQLQELSPGAGVEVGRRLVEHEQLRPHGEDGGDRRPPALALRQRVGGAARRARQAHRGEGVLDPRGNLVAAQSQVERPERHVLAHGRHEQLVVRVLEHEADPRPQRPRVRRAHRQAGDLQLAGRRGEKAVEVQHERGLAGAVRTEHGDPLAAGHPQVDAAEGVAPVGVPVREPAGRDRRAHPGPPRTARAGTSASATAARNIRSARASRRGAAAGIAPA